MAERNEQIYYFVRAHLEDCFDDGDYIDVWNEELDGDHVGMLDEDFDEYVADNEDGFLSVYKNLAYGFDPDDSYFCNTNCGYDSSNDLFEFITLDDVMQWAADRLAELEPEDLEGEIEPGHYKYYGYGKLVKLFKEHFPPEPKHSEAEIQQKIRDYIHCDLDNDQLMSLLSLEGSDHELMRMCDFPGYVADRSMHDVVGEIVKSLPCGCFGFKDPFFRETTDKTEFYSLSRFDAENEAFSYFCKIDCDGELFKLTFPTLAKIKKGEWED